MNDHINDISIEKATPVITALKLMDRKHVKLLIVLDHGHYLSMLSIGDIQRAIIADIDLQSPVEGILRKKVNVAHTTDSREEIIVDMKKRRIEFMPIINEKKKVVDIIFWHELFDNSLMKRQSSFDLPIVIMAGGQGTRLRPLTNVLPKPLIPIGEQTMIEDIMDRFVECGCHNFYISVNYKANFIRHYFDNLSKPQYHVEYFQENKPLGTAGSLHLLKERINSTFFVSNCDIIIDEDYSRVLDFHRENNNEITVVAAMKNYSIPYGTLETGEGGQLLSLQEKPELTYKINTGMYILEPHLIKEIPSDRLYHITFLIEKLLQEGRRVSVFPINEGSWTDIGNWDEYIKYIKSYAK